MKNNFYKGLVLAAALGTVLVPASGSYGGIISVNEKLLPPTAVGDFGRIKIKDGQAINFGPPRFVTDYFSNLLDNTSLVPEGSAVMDDQLLSVRPSDVLRELTTCETKVNPQLCDGMLFYVHSRPSFLDEATFIEQLKNPDRYDMAAIFPLPFF